MVPEARRAWQRNSSETGPVGTGWERGTWASPASDCAPRSSRKTGRRVPAGVRRPEVAYIQSRSLAVESWAGWPRQMILPSLTIAAAGIPLTLKYELVAPFDLAIG